jgi:predicted ATPase
MYSERKIVTEMVGRTPELEQLQSAFCAMVERCELRMVTVVGEAGIGKSRLLQEFWKWVEEAPRQARRFYGRAEAGMGSVPFSLMRAVFCSQFEIKESDSGSVAWEKFTRGYADLLGDTRAEATGPAQSLGPLLGFDFVGAPASRDGVGDAQQTRHRAFQDLGAFFRGIGSAVRQNAAAVDKPGRAVLLVLEDIHWGDDDSLDLVEHVAQTCRETPLMILCLARPMLLERRSNWCEMPARHSRVELEPLTLRESEQLVERILGQTGHAPPTLTEPILAGAGGNPFYIEELLKVLIEKRVIEAQSGSWRLEPERLAAAPMPPTLAGVLQARLESLPGLERAVLQGASVVGQVFWDSAIEDLVGPMVSNTGTAREGPVAKSELEGALAGLCRKEIIQRRETSGFARAVEYSFKHELLRDATYAGLMRNTRREHHGRVASWFIEHSGERIREFAGLVAVHFEQAGRVTEAAEWYGQAGQQARAAYAPAAAGEYFQRALSLAGGPGGSRRREEAEVRGHQAAPPAHAGARAEREFQWHEGLSDALTSQGHFAEARKSYDRLRELAASAGNAVLEARAWNGLAYLHERRGDNRASVEAAEKAEALAQRVGPTARTELVRALHLKGWAFYRLGDAAQVLSLAGQTLRLCEESGDRVRMAISFKLFGVARLQLGQYEEADRNFERGLALCTELGDRRNAAAMWSNLGESARLRGDFAEAVELYQKALAITREIGERSSEMVYLSNLGGARLGLGQLKDAEADLRQAIAVTGMPKSCSLSETYAFLAKACLGQAKLGEAFAAAQEALAIGGESENRLDMAYSWRVLGEVASAASQVGAWADIQGPRATAPTSPADCFAESLRLYEAIGAPDEQARTLLAWALFDEQQGNSAAADARRQAAQTILGRVAGPSASDGESAA